VIYVMSGIDHPKGRRKRAQTLRVAIPQKTEIS